MDRLTAIDKVKKLLRRARVNPGHEADTALALAKELIAKFDLFEVEVEPQETISAVLEQKVEQWTEVLGFAVARSVDCRVFKKPTGELHVSGGKLAVDLVLSLYVALRDYARASCTRKVPVSIPAHDNIARVATLLDKVWTNRFLYGFAKTIGDRLNKKQTAPTPQSDEPAPPTVVYTKNESPPPSSTPKEGTQPPDEAPAAEDEIDDSRYDTDDVEDEEQASTADLGDERQPEHAEEVANDMVAQGMALIREFSRGWSMYYSAQYAEGIYNLAFAHGQAAGMIVDLDTQSFVPRRQLAC